MFIYVFRLYWKTVAETTFHQVDVAVPAYTIDNLSPNSQYIIYIVAISKNGKSLPSETLIAWTDPAYPAFVEVRCIYIIYSNIKINLSKVHEHERNLKFVWEWNSELNNVGNSIIFLEKLILRNILIKWWFNYFSFESKKFLQAIFKQFTYVYNILVNHFKHAM